MKVNIKIYDKDLKEKIVMSVKFSLLFSMIVFSNECIQKSIANFLCDVLYSKYDTRYSSFNPLSANPTKWSNTLKQFVGNLPTNCLSVFDHFVGLALKGLRKLFLTIKVSRFA